MFDLLQVNIALDGAWFRVLGYGASVRIGGQPLLSEWRSRVAIKVGPVRLKLLAPHKIRMREDGE